jgi:hypothetical protein
MILELLGIFSGIMQFADAVAVFSGLKGICKPLGPFGRTVKVIFDGLYSVVVSNMGYIHIGTPKSC